MRAATSAASQVTLRVAQEAWDAKGVSATGRPATGRPATSAATWVAIAVYAG